MMTPVQILLVQTSFEMAGADGTALAARLGRRLAVRASAEQVAQLASVLVLAVRGLGRRRLLRPALRRLGARHELCRAMAQDAAFPWALVDALEDALGAGVPTAVREAWGACHLTLAALAREGSRAAA